MSEVVVHRRVLRYLDRLSQQDRLRIRTALAHLAADPIGYPGLVTMAGEWTGYYRAADVRDRDRLCSRCSRPRSAV